MKNIVVKECSNIKMEQILRLYNSVHWANYTDNPSRLESAFRHSLKILGAYSGEKLVGILRIVGDGFTIIYIQDIIVIPEYQRQGIGKTMIGEVDKLYPDVYQKVLLTDNQPSTTQFYKSCGFSLSNDFHCVAFLKFPT